MANMRAQTIALAVLGAIVALVTTTSTLGVAQEWPFDVTDLRARETLTILVFGDAGTGEAGQHRLGRSMFDVCLAQGCDFAVILGDNIYENGIEADIRDDEPASFREIVGQFDDKFAKPFESFGSLPGFHFWAVLGNHDYRRNASGTMVTYSEFNDLWRLPALHYEIPKLPDMDSDSCDAHGYGRTSRPERSAGGVDPSATVARRQPRPLEAAIRSPAGL